MRYLAFSRAWCRQRGAAAVELALILPLLAALLTVPLFFARYYWHYTVAHKAARDATRYLSSVSKAEILAKKTPIGEIEASKFARSIASSEVAELNPGPGGILVEAYCDTGLCTGAALPATVRAKITIEMSDFIFPKSTNQYLGFDGTLMITATVSMPYVGL